jgi:hypothetical protein
MTTSWTGQRRRVWREAIKTFSAKENWLFWKINHGCSPVRLSCEKRSSRKQPAQSLKLNEF